jgi:CubicO group peptidase (beta-lactamase class C family)
MSVFAAAAALAKRINAEQVKAGVPVEAAAGPVPIAVPVVPVAVPIAVPIAVPVAAPIAAPPAPSPAPVAPAPVAPAPMPAPVAPATVPVVAPAAAAARGLPGLKTHAQFGRHVKSAIKAVRKQDGCFTKDMRNGAPGYAVAVLQGESVVHLEVEGKANLGTKEDLRADHMFDLASCSKHVTALGILQLAERGRLRLEQPVAELIAGYAHPVKGRPVRVSDLLHHTSGIADYINDDGAPNTATVTAESHLAWLNKHKPHGPPGQEHEYNNSNYVLLGLIIERVSGMKYADYVRANLFAPVGLGEEHAGGGPFFLDGSAPRAACAAAVKGYNLGQEAVKKRGKPVEDPSVVMGDGNIFMSIAHMAAWASALRAAEAAPVPGFLSPESIRRAYTHGTLDGSDEGVEYACGFVTDGESDDMAWHVGSWTGTSTCWRYNRSTGLTVIALSNNEAAEAEMLADTIAIIFGDPAPEAEEEEEEGEEEEEEVRRAALGPVLSEQQPVLFFLTPTPPYPAPPPARVLHAWRNHTRMMKRTRRTRRTRRRRNRRRRPPPPPPPKRRRASAPRERKPAAERPSTPSLPLAICGSGQQASSASSGS